VDCVHVGKGAHAASWLGSLRTNEALFSGTLIAKEISRGDEQQGYAYVVRRWCRTSTGKSVCVLIVDPWSTSYRKLKLVGGLEDLAEAMQEELDQEAQNVSGMADASVAYMKTTNGCEADPEILQPRRHPWLRVRVVSTFLRSQLSTAFSPS
jgi:hypothetical protein